MRGSSLILPPEPCPYVAERTMRLECFRSVWTDAERLSCLLACGWRVFGQVYFRPACPACRACTPLRIPVRGFRPTKSQRRIWRRNLGTRFSVGPLRFTDEVYDIYRDHSWARFRRQSDRDEFLSSFYQPSCAALQSEYRIGGRLAAVGFLSVSLDAFSSVYFAFRDCYKWYGLGTLSVMAECACAAAAGLSYYYLGYCIRESPRMSYKARFGPHEYYDWGRQQWLPGERV